MSRRQKEEKRPDHRTLTVPVGSKHHKAITGCIERGVPIYFYDEPCEVYSAKRQNDDIILFLAPMGTLKNESETSAKDDKRSVSLSPSSIEKPSRRYKSVSETLSRELRDALN